MPYPLQFSLTLSLSKGFWELSWSYLCWGIPTGFWKTKLPSSGFPSPVNSEEGTGHGAGAGPQFPAKGKNKTWGYFVVFTRSRAFRNALQTGRQERGQDFTIQLTRAPWVQRPFASRDREPGKTRVCSGPLRGHHGCFLCECLPRPSAPTYFHDGCRVATRAPGFPFRCAMPVVPGKQAGSCHQVLIKWKQPASVTVVSSHPGILNIPWQEPAEPQKHLRDSVAGLCTHATGGWKPGQLGTPGEWKRSWVSRMPWA